VKRIIEVEGETQQRCCTCRDYKVLSDYHKDASKKLKVRPQCKDCYKNWMNTRRRAASKYVPKPVRTTEEKALKLEALDLFLKCGAV